MSHCVSYDQATPHPPTRHSKSHPAKQTSRSASCGAAFQIPGTSSGLRSLSPSTCGPLASSPASPHTNSHPVRLWCGHRIWFSSLNMLYFSNVALCQLLVSSKVLWGNQPPVATQKVEIPIKLSCNVKTIKGVTKWGKCVLPNLLVIYWNINCPDGTTLSSSNKEKSNMNTNNNNY